MSWAQVIHYTIWMVYDRETTSLPYLTPVTPTHSKICCWYKSSIVHMVHWVTGINSMKLKQNGHHFLFPRVCQIRSHHNFKEWLGVMTTYLIHKSHNTPVLHPTMHHFITEMCTLVHISVTKWCIVGYMSDAFWDLWDANIVQQATTRINED